MSSLVDKPRIISAEVKKRSNCYRRDIRRPHIAGELWLLSDKCSEKKTRYVEVRDGQLLVFPTFSARRLPEWRLPLYDLNLLPYPKGNPFCFSFSRRDHSIPVAIFQAQNAEDYERWVRTLAAELICQTPFDHVRFLDILGITATLQQQQQQHQQPTDHDQPLTISDRSKDRGPEKSMCLLKEKQQNMINSVVQSSFVKNCFRFKTNAHRKYESHRKTSQKFPQNEPKLRSSESDSEKENNEEISRRLQGRCDSETGQKSKNIGLGSDSEKENNESDDRLEEVTRQDPVKKTQASYLHSFYRKVKNSFTDELKSDCVDGIFRPISETPPQSPLPNTEKNSPPPKPNLKLELPKHTDLKPNFSCPNLRSDPASRTFKSIKYVRKTLSSCSECDSDDSCGSNGIRFQSVSNLLARCQESEDYVPVKDKLMLFESLCGSEPKDYSFSKIKSRSLHDLGRVQDEQFELDNTRKCQYHSSVSNICPERLKNSELRKGSSSNLVKNICRYFEHRTSGQVRSDQSAVWSKGSEELESMAGDESISGSQNPANNAYIQGVTDEDEPESINIHL